LTGQAQAGKVPGLFMTLRPTVLALAVLLATSSLAQSLPPASYAPAPPAEYDSVRLRGGFNLGGGYVFGPAHGPIIDLSLRLGVQLGRVFGLAIQTQPNLFIISAAASPVVGFGIYNSLLAEFTLFDFLQLGAGPSLDYLAAASCPAGDTSCTAAEGVGFGVHGRAAIILGGRNPQGGARGGFSISLNVHPLFLGNGNILFLSTLGIGADWY
jgi:hypothetical protein